MRSSGGVNVGVKSRLTSAGDLYRVNVEPITESLRNSRNAGPADAALLGQHGDLGQGLGDDAEEHVVADLDQPGHLAVADVGDAAAERSQQRLDLVERLLGPGHGEGQLARLDDLGVAADRRGEELRPRLAAAAARTWPTPRPTPSSSRR